MKKSARILAAILAAVLCLALIAPALAVETYDDFPVHATASILVDADYNEVLFEYNADEKRYPASITKVMTSLLTMEAIADGKLTMDTPVTLPDRGLLYMGIGADGSTADLKPGEILTVRDLLNCALIPSANEACNGLAMAVAGDIPTFIQQMNDRTAKLGMKNTHWSNTHGYHDNNHYTTARDISIMCQEAMKHPDFREIVSSVKYVIPPTNMCDHPRDIHDTNALVSTFRITDFYYPYAIGIKTGSTTEAGYCLASAAEKDGKTMIAVVLGGENWRLDGEINPHGYFIQSTELLEHGFNDFERQVLLDPVQPIKTLPVSLCKEQDYITILPAHGLEASLPKGLDPATFERTVELPESLEAPVEKGQTVGSITLSKDGKEYGNVELVATATLQRSKFMATMAQIRHLASQLWFKLVVLAVVILILVILVKVIFFPSNRRYGSRGRKFRPSGYRGKWRR